jgi:D-alanyl-D-alanine carboxypeptidase
VRSATTTGLLLTLAGCAGTALEPTPDPQARTFQLQDALARWAAAEAHQGVSASVVFADGTQWNGVAGQAGPGEALRTEHLIWIASITKTMTGALILQLADESRLTLEDPVSRWLLPHPHVDPAITLRQLLNHTSGVDNYTDDPALATAIAARPERVFTTPELLAFVGPPRFAPGARTQYTNTAFLLLAEVAEEATGRPLVDLLHERLWDPLRLTEVFLPGREAPGAPVAHARGSVGIVSPLDQMSLLTIGQGAFGLFASARTVARWGHELFTGRVLSARMQGEMRRLVPAAGNIPGESGAGLGIRSYGYLGRTQFGHSGGASLGSSLLLHDPASGVTVAVLMNQGQRADHFVLAPALLDLATRH